MITQETIQKLATRHQVPEFPNIVREYFQHLFLSYLYRIDGTQNIMFKGGTALRIIYGSPRFSEDLDFSIFGIETHKIKDFVENVFSKVLVEIERVGIKVELGPKPGLTREGYYGEAFFEIYDYSSVTVSISVSKRNERQIIGEIETIPNDFVPTYNIYRLPQELLIGEKIDALLDRKSPRDFYDIYYIMRKGLLTSEQKKRLAEVRNLVETSDINYQSELGVLLPQDQQVVIKDFKKILLNELIKQSG